jgi:acyl-CoA thioesterase
MPAQPAHASSFERAVAVRPRGDGDYGAVIDPAWCGPRAPNGGVLAALMLRAAQARLGPDAPPPRTIAAHYLAAPAAGPVRLSVEVLRRGRRVSACEVRLREPDAETVFCQATIVCSAAREQPVTLRRAAPSVPPPGAVPALDGAAAAGLPRMFEQLELRPAVGGIPFTGARQARSGGWIALRDDPGPLDPARLCALCDLWWPAVFAHLRALNAVPTLQLTVYLREPHPELCGPVLARFETLTVHEGHLEERGELWSPDGRLLAESVQLALML